MLRSAAHTYPRALRGIDRALCIRGGGESGRILARYADDGGHDARVRRVADSSGDTGLSGRDRQAGKHCQRERQLQRPDIHVNDVRCGSER